MSKTHTFRVKPWTGTHGLVYAGLVELPTYWRCSSGKLMLTLPVESLDDFNGELDVTVRRIPSKREKQIETLTYLMGSGELHEMDSRSVVVRILDELADIDKENE
jgi:hypothetical protein